MTIYRGSQLTHDFKSWVTPKFQPGDLIQVWEHIYLVLEIKQERLFLCLNEHQNIIPFIPTNFYKYEII